MNASPELALEVASDLAQLGAVSERLDAFWVEHGVPEEAQADLNIAVEEIVSNVMRHGGTREPIRLRVAVDAEEVCVDVEDQGRAFNPLTHPAPDPHTPLAARRPGGLGIFMVVKLMDRTSYERRDGWNCFRMVRRRQRA